VQAAGRRQKAKNIPNCTAAFHIYNFIVDDNFAAIRFVKMFLIYIFS